MRTPIQLHRLVRLFILLVAGSALPAVASPLTLADNPLFLSTDIPPNLILTLDDSGSMSRAFTPDLCGNVNGICDSGDNDSDLDGRHLKSAYFNPLYYNPNITYEPPVDAAGNALTTSFTAAYINGFCPTCTYSNGIGSTVSTINLSTSYRPSSGLFLSRSSGEDGQYHQFMRHYWSSTTKRDVRCSTSDRCQYLNASGTWVDTGATNDCDADNDNNATEDDGYCRTRQMPAYYYVFDSSNASCTSTDPTDSDCYDIRIVSATSGPGGTDERQNFANWYSFYRTRNLMTVSATALAFADLPDTTRVAWQSLNSCRGSTSSLVTSDCEGWQTTSSNFSNAIKPFAGTQKSNFYTWLFRLKTYTSTPLRQAMSRAGEYYKASGDGSPYDNDLTSSAAEEYSCRKNFHLLMTDGIWNDSVTGYGNYDSTNRTFPDGTNYTSQRPYLDTNSNSLADVAFSYWATDLRTGLANNVLPNYVDRSGTATAQYFNAKNDPANWQHMVNFTVGLGLTTFLNNTGLTWGGDTYTGSYPQILAGSKSWPSTGSNADGDVADLWHAAVNSRGKFFSAEDPSVLNQAFSDAIQSISAQSSSASALSANSTSIQVTDGQSSTLVYQAKFNSGDWSGTLLALPLQADGSIGTAVWDAGALIPPHNARDIYTFNGSSGQEFIDCTTNLNLYQRTVLNTHPNGTTDNRCTDRLNWLRGNSYYEARNYNSSTRPTATFRNRTASVMGDIIHSDPFYIQAPDFGYDVLTEGDSGVYEGFRTDHANRPAMIYVGANDGMLHAIRADRLDVDSGKELFAYIPAGVYPHLNHLTDTGYTHRYYVDGAPTVGDAYVSGGWKTVLVSGLNSGGKTIFALDVTDPTTFGADDVMWEYNAPSASGTHPDPDLGYTFSQPQIARLHNGAWAAIFGNGYNSTAEKAYLYIVNLANGNLIRKIEADTSCTSACGNGLSTPILVDTDNDKVVDAVYAGDLQGNLWKFDLSGATSGSWGVAYSGTALFTARDSSGGIQPITAQPRVYAHPDGGRLVLFGTGQYLTTSDLSNTETQTFYGIRDNGEVVAGTARTTLQAQTIAHTGTVGGYQSRSTSTNPVDWNTQQGWYMDFTPGERIVSRAVLAYDRIIFTTLIPNDDPCNAGGDGWIMQLETLTGTRPVESVFDLVDSNDGEVLSDDDDLSITITNPDGSVSNTSVVVTGIRSPVNITTTPVLVERIQPTSTESGISTIAFTGSTGGTDSIDIRGGSPVPIGPPPPPPPGGAPAGRVYWMQIL